MSPTHIGLPKEGFAVFGYVRKCGWNVRHANKRIAA